MKKVGEIALTKGFILPHHLQTALETQKGNKKDTKLGNILLELGFISEPQYKQLEEELENYEKKKRICLDWMHRRTGFAPEEIGKYIIFTNFFNYLEIAAEMYNLKDIKLSDRIQMPTVLLTKDIAMVCVRMGSPYIALALDIFAAIDPTCIIFAGKCGGIKRDTKIGEYLLPSSAIRGEGTSDDYLDKSVPSLPSFTLQHLLAKEVNKEGQMFHTGVIHTTNRRLWEFDRDFCHKVIQEKAISVDMETATFFSVGFANNIACGALHLISDLPLMEVKTEKTGKEANLRFAKTHVKIVCKTLEAMLDQKINTEHLKHYGYGYY